MRAGIDNKSSLFGKPVLEMNIWNQITTAGKAAAPDRLSGITAMAAFTYVAVGTGTTPVDPADTTLTAEIEDSGLVRTTGTVSAETTTTTDDTAQVLYKWESITDTKAVTEAGLFNASSAGTMVANQVFSAINVVSGDTLQITWKIDFS